MANPESPQQRKKMQVAADYVRRTTPGLNKPKKVKQLVQLKVIDFTIWNGFKFGFGFMIGVAGFSFVAGLLGFLLKMIFIGLFSTMGPVV